MTRDYRFANERGTSDFGFITLLLTPEATQSGVLSAIAANMARAADEARRLGDLWTRDVVWAGDRQTRLHDFRLDNCCSGAAGCQALHCLFQMWKVGGLNCDEAMFASFILQMDRFALAQSELKNLMTSAPVTSLFRTLSVGGTVAQEIANLGATPTGNQNKNTHISQNAAAWAEFCTKAMALVAVSRWALNLRWTLAKQGNAALWANERQFMQRFYQLNQADFGSEAVTPPADRDHETIVETWKTNEACDYSAPEPSFVPKGSTYVREWEGSWWGRINYPSPLLRSLATPSLIRLSDNAVLYGQSGSRGMIGTCNVGDRAWLRERPLFNAVKVPVNERDFWPMFDVALPGQSGFYSPHWEQMRFNWPSWAAGTRATPLLASDTVKDALRKHFQGWPTSNTQLDTSGGRSQNALQLQNLPASLVGYNPSSDPNALKLMYPSPITQVMYVMALAQDIIDHTPGDFVAAATMAWTAAVATMPEQFRMLTPAQMLEINRTINQSNVNAVAAVYGAVAGTVTSIVAAINPIAGAIVGAVLALVGLLISFALEACIERPVSPPCISSPFIRYIESNSVPDSPCDSRTTEAGGASAIALKVEIFGAAAARGFTPEQIFDAINTETDAGVNGSGEETPNPNDPDQGGVSTTAVIVGAAVVGGLLLLAAANKKKSAAASLTDGYDED